MRKKMALSVVAIALAMLLGFGAAVDQAKADSILFPWIVKSGAISTIVTVVNTAGIPLPFAGVPQLHWEYFYKDPDNAQTTPCTLTSFKMDTSQMDIVTVDVAGNINGGLPMWGDTNNAVFGAPNAALPAAGDRRAVLLVDNNTPLPVFYGSNLDGTLYGEAMVLEISSGAAWGYIGYNSGGPFSDTTGPGAQNGFVTSSNMLDTFGDILGGVYAYTAAPDTAAFVAGELAPVALMPPSDIKEKFFLTPVDDINASLVFAGGPSQWASDGMRWGNINASLSVCAVPGTLPGGPGGAPVLSGTCLIPGITLNDEAPLNSQKRKNIVCTSADDVSALVDPGTLTSWNANGGQAWTYLYPRMGNLLPAPSYRYSPNMMIGKLDWIDGASNIDGTAVSGTFNNFIQPRSNLWVFGPTLIPFGLNNIVPVP